MVIVHTSVTVSLYWQVIMA